MAVTNDAAVCGSAGPTCIIADTPVFAAGTTDVVVTNMDPATGIIDSCNCSYTLPGGYTFLAAPSISQVSPSSGTVFGGTQVTITGSNFQSGATVSIGGQPATVMSPSGTSAITVTTPAGTATGTSQVMVANPDGQTSNTWIYTYQ
jgi:hypothetical protein